MTEDGSLSIIIGDGITNLVPNDLMQVTHDFTVHLDKGNIDFTMILKYKWTGDQLEISKEIGKVDVMWYPEVDGGAN
jgi:hypothetical protein